jgi:hypothetical protein
MTFYLDDGTLIYVTEKMEYFHQNTDTDSQDFFDYTKLEYGYQNRYYFDGDKLIAKILEKGTKGFIGDTDKAISDHLIIGYKNAIKLLSHYEKK